VAGHERAQLLLDLAGLAALHVEAAFSITGAGGAMNSFE
jgi:hypothetical protein